MKLFASSIFALLLSTTHAFPQEPTQLSAKDVVNAASANRYGQNSGAIDQTILDDVFGSGPNTNSNNGVTDHPDSGNPQGYIEDDQFDNCTFYKDYGFECVPYYQCNNGYIITDGAGLFDIRSGFNDVLDPGSSKCESYLEVCCRDESYEGVPLPAKPVPTPAPTPAPVVTAAPQTEPPPVPLNKCGRRNIAGIDVRIQNEKYGGSTQFGEWPHMCAVLREVELAGKTQNLYVCGASLIAPGVAMTGAHCVKDYAEDPLGLKVRCGEWDTQQTIEPRRHEDRNAFDISIHPLFNPRNLQNDVALIHLDSPFELQPHINTICLPDQYQLDYNQFSGNECFATGWGKDKFGKEGNYQVIMKQVKLDLVEHQECEAIMQGTRLGKRFRLDDSFLCAGGVPGEDTCKGDGGGPLVCPIYGTEYDQQYVQTGIVAWGLGCGTEVPGVYANVSDSLCFIDWATKCAHGQDADFYGYRGCNRWAKRQYCQYKNELTTLRAAADDDQPSISAHKQLRKITDFTRRFETAVKGCKYGADYQQAVDCSYYDYYEDSDDIDLSTNAREGPKPKTNNEEEDALIEEGEEEFGRSGAASK